MSTGLLARVRRLEGDRGGAGGCGPNCPPRFIRFYERDGHGGAAVLLEGTPPGPCRRCGRPAVSQLDLIYTPDFYNAARG